MYIYRVNPIYVYIYNMYVYVYIYIYTYLFGLTRPPLFDQHDALF